MWPFATTTTTKGRSGSRPPCGPKAGAHSPGDATSATWRPRGVCSLTPRPRSVEVDILVNNAGVSEEKAVEAITLEAVDWMMNVHFKATFVLSQLAYIRMKPRGYGRIINVSSNLAYKGAPGLAHYSAAKAAVLGFTRSMAQEAAPHGVLVNAIAPGPIDTRLNDTLSPEWKAWKVGSLPIRRFGRPEEVAPSAVLLASADGSFYVGQTLHPNGGDVMP